VAILTDGRLLGAGRRMRERADEIRTLLRNLSFWPRVTFIDFGGDGELSALAAAHELRVIKPEDAPMAISDLALHGGGDARASAAAAGHTELVGDARAWAAACALTPHSMSDRTALTLRRKLGLNASPWVIEHLRERAASSAGGMSWSLSHRRPLLAWLAEVEELPGSGKALPPGSLLARALAAWDEILQEREAEQRRLAGERDHVWDKSPERLEVEIERGFLHLWDDPKHAAARLYDLFCHHPSRVIRDHMRDLAPRECKGHGEDVIVLPWSLAKQSSRTQVVLREMGFGAKVEGLPGHRHLRPGRLWLALGLCLGLLLGAGTAVVKRLWNQPEPHPVLELGDISALPDKGYASLGSEPHIERDGSRWWPLDTGALWSRDSMRRRVDSNQTVHVGWKPRELPCVEIKGRVEIRRCTSDGRAPVTTPTRWSFAVIAKQYERMAQSVASELLDSGTVDGVFLLDAPFDYPPEAFHALARPLPDGASDQLLMVLPEPWPDVSSCRGNVVVLSIDDLGRLRGILDFTKGAEATLRDRLRATGALAQLRDRKGNLADFKVRGLGECGAPGQPCCDGGDGARGYCDGAESECKNDVCVAAAPDSNDPRAKDDPCTPGERRCAGGDAVMACRRDGTGQERQACALGEACTDGACQPVTGALLRFEPLDAWDNRLWQRRKLHVQCTANHSEPAVIPPTDKVWDLAKRHTAPVELSLTDVQLGAHIGVTCALTETLGPSRLKTLSTSKQTHTLASDQTGPHELLLRLSATENPQRNQATTQQSDVTREGVATEGEAPEDDAPEEGDRSLRRRDRTALRVRYTIRPQFGRR
jgi:hypothetical protein